MTSDDSFRAWSAEFTNRLIKYTDLTGSDILTDYKPVKMSDYRVVVPNLKQTALKIAWGPLQQYCTDAGYVRKFRPDGSLALYRYNLETGYYEPCTEEKLTTALSIEIKRNFPLMELSANFAATAVVNIIPALPDVDDIRKSSIEFEALFEYYTDGEIIPFANGVYSLKYNRLLPKTSYVFIENPLSVDFRPASLECDIRSRYMEMMCDDECLFEYMFEQLGYAMYARTFIIPTCTIFYGSGANGKSVVIDTLCRIVGHSGISTLSMYDMTNSFGIAQSEGKLINISSDSSAGLRNNTTASADVAEFIKKATSGEPYMFNPKNKNPHIGYGPRKFLFASNVMLNFGTTAGIDRRLCAVPFRATFKEDRRVKAQFESKEAVEWFAMQSLVSMMCTLRRAMGKDMFTDTHLTGQYIVCDIAKEARDDQLIAGNSLYLWVSEDLGVDFNDKDAVRDIILSTPDEDWYMCFRSFCVDMGKSNILERRTFNSRMKALYAISFAQNGKSGALRHYTAYPA